MTKRYVQQLEKEVNEGKTERAKRAKKNAKKTRKKITKKVDKISKKSVKPESLTKYTKTDTKTPIKKPLNDTQKQLIILLSESAGMRTITDICSTLNIERQTYYNWIKAHPEILEAAKVSFSNDFDAVKELVFEKAKEDNNLLKYLCDTMIKHPFAFSKMDIAEARREFEQGGISNAEPIKTVVISLGGGDQPNFDSRDLSKEIYIEDAEVVE